MDEVGWVLCLLFGGFFLLLAYILTLSHEQNMAELEKAHYVCVQVEGGDE